MYEFSQNQSVGEIVVKFPKASDIFKNYKIDFCCGGDKSLKDAANESNINADEVLDQINKLYQDYIKLISKKDIDYQSMPLNALVDHIINKHHTYLNVNLPIISEILAKILKVHGVNHPELLKVYKLFHTIKMELDAHLIKEETIQYPSINKYLTTRSKEDLEKAINVIKELQDEHTGAGNVLREIREITNDYEFPCDACNTYFLAFNKLKELESDIFQHIHLENNILFPRLYSLK